MNSMSFLLAFLYFMPNFDWFVRSEVIEKVFNVHYIGGSPDGVFKRQIVGINGLFPGPTIEATIGDTLRVTLVNNIQDGDNTTIHWHGMHQSSTPFEDGTAQISQCPLKAGHHQVYEFPLTQAGTYWYHSHVRSQYTEGLWGALVIKNKPERYEYDDEIVITLNDWYHRPAHDNEMWLLSQLSRGNPPYPDSGMINGRGRANCTVAPSRRLKCDAGVQRRHIFRVTPGKRYRIRVINVSGYAAFRFSIDHHKLHVIEVDGIDTMRPEPVDIAVVTAAQRYSFLVTMDAPKLAQGHNKENERFLIRADMMTDILSYFPGNTNPYPEALLANVTAVLKYEMDPHNPGHDFNTEPHDYRAAIEPRPPGSDAVYLDENKLQPHDGVLAPAYFDQEFVLTATFKEDDENIRRGSFNASPFNLPDGKPLLARLMHDEEIPADTFPVYIQLNDVVQLVINNPFNGPHPFHLHGYSFYVLGSGARNDGDYDSGRHNLVLDGAKRDTVLVEHRSWTVIRFLANNPGLWSFHCHIDWHSVMGMGMVFIVAPEVWRETMLVPEEAKRVCRLQGIEI